MARRPALNVDLGASDSQSKPADTQPRKPAATRSKRNVAIDLGPAMPGDDVPEATGRAGYKVRTRIEKPHVSLYMAPETMLAIKRLALDEGTTAQALYRRGLLLMLQEYGLYLDRTVDDV